MDQAAALMRWKIKKRNRSISVAKACLLKKSKMEFNPPQSLESRGRSRVRGSRDDRQSGGKQPRGRNGNYHYHYNREYDYEPYTTRFQNQGGWRDYGRRYNPGFNYRQHYESDYRYDERRSHKSHHHSSRSAKSGSRTSSSRSSQSESKKREDGSRKEHTTPPPPPPPPPPSPRETELMMLLEQKTQQCVELEGLLQNATKKHLQAQSTHTTVESMIVTMFDTHSSNNVCDMLVQSACPDLIEQCEFLADYIKCCESQISTLKSTLNDSERCCKNLHEENQLYKLRLDYTRESGPTSPDFIPGVTEQDDEAEDEIYNSIITDTNSCAAELVKDCEKAKRKYKKLKDAYLSLKRQYEQMQQENVLLQQSISDLKLQSIEEESTQSGGGDVVESQFISHASAVETQSEQEVVPVEMADIMTSSATEGDVRELVTALEQLIYVDQGGGDTLINVLAKTVPDVLTGQIIDSEISDGTVQQPEIIECQTEMIPAQGRATVGYKCPRAIFRDDKESSSEDDSNDSDGRAKSPPRKIKNIKNKGGKRGDGVSDDDDDVSTDDIKKCLKQTPHQMRSFTYEMHEEQSKVNQNVFLQYVFKHAQVQFQGLSKGNRWPRLKGFIENPRSHMIRGLVNSLNSKVKHFYTGDVQYELIAKRFAELCFFMHPMKLMLSDLTLDECLNRPSCLHLRVLTAFLIINCKGLRKEKCGSNKCIFCAYTTSSNCSHVCVMCKSRHMGDGFRSCPGYHSAPLMRLMITVMTAYIFDDKPVEGMLIKTMVQQLQTRFKGFNVKCLGQKVKY